MGRREKNEIHLIVHHENVFVGAAAFVVVLVLVFVLFLYVFR